MDSRCADVSYQTDKNLAAASRCVHNDAGYIDGASDKRLGTGLRLKVLEVALSVDFAG